MRFAFVPSIVCVALAIACASATPAAIDRLRPCTSDEGPTDAYCGSLRVFENRATREGRTIDLRIVVLPALSRNAKPDPVFFLAGGPGQGAAAMSRSVRELFRRVQSERDIVLVDQRGTGKSNPLNCSIDTDDLSELDEDAEAAIHRLRTCLARYDADVTLYTTSIAMDDLDDVRRYLGYDKINLYGGSYGTRAALEFVRRHEARVRAVVLDGVAPTELRLPLFFARDAQRSLDLLLEACSHDASCARLYPNLAARLRTLVERLDRAPVPARLVHPRTGAAADLTIKGSFVTTAVFGALYSPLASSLVPALIERAERGDFQGMLALAMINDGLSDNLALGMQMSVMCAEDGTRISAEQARRESADTLFATRLVAPRLKACEFWPKGQVEPGYYDPVDSAVPALILSGELDPVTPPAWGELVHTRLRRSSHFIAPGTGHGVIGTACGARLVHEFIRRGTTEGVDASCLQLLKRPPFFLSPAGPEPGNASTHAP